MKKIVVSLVTFIFISFSSLSFAISDKEICEGNGINFDKANVFMNDFREVLKTDDKNKIADMMDYPVRVNTTNKSGKIKSVYLKTKQDFLKQYPKLFTQKTKTGLAKGDVFCNDQGASVGGFVWIKTDADSFKIFAINPA